MARLQKKKQSKKEKRVKKKSIESETVKEEKKAGKPLQAGTKKLPASKSATLDQSKKQNIFKQGMDYLSEVQSELKKVTWPTRKQTLGTTLVVIVLVFIVSIFLGLFDYGFSKLIQAVLA